jgi:tetratricopeptide (TPR) repeat protein
MKPSYFEHLFEQLCKRLQDDNNLKKISGEFMNLTTDRERIRFLVQHDSVKEIIHPPKSTLDEKSADQSRCLRDEGNKFFKAKNFRNSIQLYTESLSWAPFPTDVCDQSISLAFANRSASLFQLAEYQMCLEDISCALRYGYPNELRYKLYDRRGQCLLAVGSFDDALANFIEAKQHLNVSELNVNRRQQLASEIDRRILTCRNRESTAPCPPDDSVELVKCEKSLPDLLDGKSTDYPSLSQMCAVTYAADRGRFIIAKRDIFPGDVILVEKPYASVLLAENRLNHCDHCFKPTLAPVPCSSCHHALYCNDECRKAAWSSYHDVECRIRSALSSSGVDKFATLAVRAVILSRRTAALDQAMSACCLDEETSAGDKNEVYTADSYRAICTLVTHAENRTAHDLFRRSAIAVFLTRCLQSAGFFDSENPSGDTIAAVGGILLSHLQSFPCNAHEISEFDLVTGAVATSVPHELGAGIYATLSLFNHSCNPAVTRNFYGDTCVVRAIRSVRAGDELSDNYGAVYAIQSRDERRNKLKPQYYFECCCEACVGDWPLFTTACLTGPRWRCSGCRSVLPSGVQRCPECSKDFTVVSYMDKLRRSDILYRKAFDKLLVCRIDEALGDMLDHLRIMDDLLSLPWPDYNACQEAVKQCFSIMANCRIIRES